MTMMTHDLLSGLDDAQRSAVQAPLGPVCVLAGAGTGKTRTITHRIAHMVATGRHEPGEILAVTFTTRAAGEMRSRLRLLGVPAIQAKTFHAAALGQLRYFWPRAVGGPLWPVVDRKIRLVVHAAKQAGAGTDTPMVRDLAGEIEWAKATLVAPDDYVTAVGAARRDTPLPAATVAEVYRRYEAAKTAAEQLDFDDLLLHACAILENDEDAARTFRARYRCFVVDEYQDVTPLQQRMLDAWLGGRDDVTVVGDANQTIYSFAGASPGYLLDFEQRYPGATVHRLQRDYRSTPQVVGLANEVIAASRGRTARMRLNLTAVLPDGPAVRFDEYPDEPAEAAAIAARIAELVRTGTPASSMAVLYRINAQSEVYEQALADAGVAYVVRGGERFFSRAEIRTALAALRTAAAGVADRAGDVGADGSGDDGAGDTDGTDRAGDDAGDTGGTDGTDGTGDDAALVPTVRAVLEPIGLTATAPPGGAQRERWDGLAALVSVAEELAAADPGAGLPQFVRELDQRAQTQHTPEVEGVTLASLHAAKGLEWEVVFLAGLTDGTLPIQHADTPEAIEEERRLLYVGVTRARTTLALSWAQARHEGGRRARRRSRFLTGIAPDPPRPERGRGRAGRCRVCGGRLRDPAEVKAGRCARCPSNADPALVAALKSWRKERASQASVPAFVIFSDATLTAIAERRPTDDAALLSIPGIGRSKLDRYGRDVIGIVTQAR